MLWAIAENSRSFPAFDDARNNVFADAIDVEEKSVSARAPEISPAAPHAALRRSVEYRLRPAPAGPAFHFLRTAGLPRLPESPQSARCRSLLRSCPLRRASLLHTLDRAALCHPQFRRWSQPPNRSAARTSISPRRPIVPSPM